MSLHFLIGPIVGAMIGGITNGIAIKMLFRPINPIKIGKYTLPFTPGVIPKEKDRIATKVGGVVSKQLLNEEVLKEWLTKEEIIEAIKEGARTYLRKNLENDNTVNDKIAQFVGEDRATFLICEGEEFLTDKIYTKLVKMEVGKIIVDRLKKAFKEGSFGNLLGPMSFLINDGLVENLGAKLEPLITQFVKDEGEAMIRQAVEDESKQILSTPISEYAEKINSYEEFMIQILENYYRLVVEQYLGRMLIKLNIAKIIEQRILSLDMLEIEEIILSIMNKELNAIVWFGVLLGGIMGVITSIL